MGIRYMKQLSDEIFKITTFVFADVDFVDAFQWDVVVGFSDVDGNLVLFQENVGIVGECGIHGDFVWDEGRMEFEVGVVGFRLDVVF